MQYSDNHSVEWFGEKKYVIWNLFEYIEEVSDYQKSAAQFHWETITRMELD
jgi:hypothetical protein